MNRFISIVRESAQLAYGGEEQMPFYEKDLVKAQFVVELNEGLGYPLSSISLEVPVLVNGSGFQYIDILVLDREGEVVIAAIVEAPQEYEKKQKQAMRSLYRKVSALARSKRVRWLVYYTRWYQKGGILQKRKIVVDYAKYPTYHAWQAADFPSVGVLPAHEKENEK